MATAGVVTARCKPYPNWVRSFGIRPFTSQDNVLCLASCLNASLSYRQSLYFAHSYYRLPADEGTIRLEIASHGSVVAHLNIVSLNTFWHTDETVYSCTDTSQATHGVRLIGWGQLETGDKYWLAVNSWGRQWGRNGTFRIARGSNACHVEELVTSMLPLI